MKVITDHLVGDIMAAVLGRRASIADPQPDLVVDQFYQIKDQSLQKV